MDSKFHGHLPPLKRFRFMQQQQEEEDRAVASSILPAKKRKESRDPPLAVSATSTTYSLPAKKRVWAVQPDFFAHEPVSPPLDLNVEYKPPPAFAEETEAVKEDNDGDDVVGVDDDDDGIVCAICQSTDGDPSDPIVFCDGCDLMVHATCYGNPLVKAIPDDDWFCSQCLVSSSEAKKHGKSSSCCCLCPIKGGALKPTVDGRWAHIVCALLVPEVFFADAEGREGIDCSKVPKKRWEDKCYVCKSRSGCAVECSEPKCPLAFHVTCGLKEDLCIEYREGRKKDAIVAGFCKNHTELWEKQQQTGKFKIVAREERKK
uniref:Birch protein n=1 Tax=Betula platyphylla TaxID=78630 RepID=A0A9E9NQ61_BETPL|nr:birch protein [Betula platyphylla]